MQNIKMLENIDRIKERIQTLNNGFKSLNNFSETKQGELFGKIMQMRIKTASEPEKIDNINDNEKTEKTQNDQNNKNTYVNLNDLLTMQYLNTNNQLGNLSGLNSVNTLLNGINKR